ncbi:hypothetical protein GQX73_g3213 [Xylaria multiplex]|uniref:DUF7708 domain-containing protein n=1 Tax=Xylaria multiplex TaxID=323545 RepID=A0A7C8MPF5_9PEZI|nr:hypothetical protein GQX73_g3213 [Xylaria multiplex]
MVESSEFSSYYRPKEGNKRANDAHDIFQDTLALFSSELSNDKKKLNWIIDSGHGNVESILAAVNKARVTYEAQKGGSKVREALVAFSETVHHYSGIMDVFVSHHPEYTALAYGAIRFLFVGVVNHQKLLTGLCTALRDIANLLPRAELIMELYSTSDMRKIIVDIYANIMKFLLRALSWYQESKGMRMMHSITRPIELRYSDLLENIASLSRAMTENALASSHAEQRDMHTDITTLNRWRPHIEAKIDDVRAKIDYMGTKIDEVMAKLDKPRAQSSEVNELMMVRQVISASSRLNTSQRLSEIQLAQVLEHISILNLPEPIKAFQVSLFMAKRGHARPSNRGPPFWLDSKVQRWNNSMESSLIIINGMRKLRLHLQYFCARSVESLRDLKLPVIWALKTLVSDKTTVEQVSTIDLLKYLVYQAIKVNENIHTDAALALRLGTHLRAQTEEDWVRALASALQGIPLIYIILDIEVLNRFSEPSVTDFWPNAFFGLFTELSTRSVKTIVRVAIISYGSLLLKGPSSDGNRSHVVTVGGTNRIRGPTTARLSIRNRAPSRATARESLNLEALGDGCQARRRVSRKPSRLQKAR